MNDNVIINDLFMRKESALDALSDKYSRLYNDVIRQIVHDECDVKECANDVLLAVWNSIPPNKPDNLSSYVCKIARRIGIDRLRYIKRQKRDPDYLVALSELNDCFPSGDRLESFDNKNEVIRTALSDFIRELEPRVQILFVRRYIYLESVDSLSKRFGIKENNISAMLYRARKRLKKKLESKGVSV